ncbi:MAG: hypothetical protein HFI21_07495 [Lachnospiraceae bacterium]|nr:hypothetical protein [Lachnospiraceae bacterium]
MIGIGIFLAFMIVMPFSLAKSAGMAERKFEELQDKEVQRNFLDQFYWEHVEKQKEEEKQYE